MTPEEKKAIEDNVRLTGELRGNFEEFKKGSITKMEYEEKDKKISVDILALKARMDEIDLERQRLKVMSDSQDGKASPGAVEYKANFFGFLRAGDLRLGEKAKSYVAERKALVSDTSGEVLFPEQLETEIYRVLPKINVLRGLCTVRPLTISNKIRRRSLTEVQMGWGKLELGGAAPETTVVPGEEFQHVEDLQGLTKVGKDELADGDISLESILIDSFGRAKSDKEETGFMTGRGHAYEEPEGMLNGSTLTRVLTAAADAITIDDTLNLAYAVPAQYRRNGAYLFPSTTELAIRKLKNAVSGDYYWQPSVQLGRPATLNGYPIETQDNIPAIASATSCDIGLFGDFKAGYRILDRAGMTMQRIVELFTLAGLIGLLATFRVGGGVIRADAIRVLREHS